MCDQTTIEKETPFEKFYLWVSQIFEIRRFRERYLLISLILVLTFKKDALGRRLERFEYLYDEVRKSRSAVLRNKRKRKVGRQRPSEEDLKGL